MSSAQYNHRASLLNGLRTGGVRSAATAIPHTAAPGATFNLPRFPTRSHTIDNSFLEEEEDQLLDIPHHFHGNRNGPMTAAVDGVMPFSQQQSHYGANPNGLPFSPGFVNPAMMSPAVQNQAMSMQMLQLEMMRIQAQAMQNHQYQAELLAQAQYQQQVQNSSRRGPFNNNNPPATAGPTNHAFDLRAAALSAQSRKANQADQRSQLGLGPVPSPDDQVPMTAALGGRFGSRSASFTASALSSSRHVNGNSDNPPPTPGGTTVISGGTSLGGVPSTNYQPAPSKSDSVSSWRRGTSLTGTRIASSPVVKVTPASDSERTSPPPGFNAAANANAKARPQPLRFNLAASQPLPAVTVVDTDEDGDADSSSSSGKTHSSPTTPRSSASSNEMPPSPREDASKKLYELGMGYPTSALPDQQQYSTVPVASHRMASQPTRQPRGPPSGADELGPKNFATRIRRKAIGGLLGARERREVVEAF